MLTQEYHVPLDAQLNLTLQHFHVPPRPAEPYFHWHHQLEISLVRSGTGVYWSEDREYEAGEGDIFIFNSTEPHALGVTSSTDMEHIVLSFEPELIGSIESHVTDPRCLRILLGHSESMDNRIPANLETASTIRGWIEEMVWECKNNEEAYELMIQSKLQSILVLLIRHYSRTILPSQTPIQRASLHSIHQVIHYIDTHLCEKSITLPHLASLCHMNPAYFSTFFKKYYGISVKKYILKKRIHLAVHYLKSTDKTVLEIANLCGFNNTSNFNKAFKQITDRTPSYFRT